MLPCRSIDCGRQPVDSMDAPREEILDVLGRHDAVRALFDNDWLHLLALDGGQIVARYSPGLAFKETVPPCFLAA